MRVLHIIDFLPNYHSIYGGAEIATERLVKGLSNSGIENFFIISFPDKNLNVPQNIMLIKTTYNYIDFKKPKSFINRFLSVIDFYKTIFPFDIFVFLNSRKILKKIKPDVIHFHNFKKISFSPLLWAKIFKIPSFLTIYDYWFFCPNEALIYKNGTVCKFYNSTKCFNCFKIPLKFRIFLPFRRIFFDFFLNMINGFIFLSYSSLKIGISYGIPKKKSKVIYQIFENFTEKELKFPKKNIILYIGWVQYRKGLHILIDALEKIIKEIKDVELYVVGEIENVEKKYVEYIFKKIKEKKLEDYVRIIGKVSKEKIKEYMETAKIIVIPEQWENMSPVVLVEAMFNKKAIVASKVGGIPEFVKDGKDGFLCQPNNPDEFATKIIKFLKNEELIKRCGENAFKKAKEIWDNKKNVEETIKFYYEILKNG